MRGVVVVLEARRALVRALRLVPALRLRAGLLRLAALRLELLRLAALRLELVRLAALRLELLRLAALRLPALRAVDLAAVRVAPAVRAPEVVRLDAAPERRVLDGRRAVVLLGRAALPPELLLVVAIKDP